MKKDSGEAWERWSDEIGETKELTYSLICRVSLPPSTAQYRICRTIHKEQNISRTIIQRENSNEEELIEKQRQGNSEAQG